ncbi:MAG: aldehyde dehydrogenase family protein, partial [Anaerovoracaceae bacterium]
MNIIDNDLLSIQEARIRAENAKEAQGKLATFSQSRLDGIVEAMADEISKYAKELAILSNDETDYGKWEDKYLKNTFVCAYLRRSIRGMRCVGIIREDREQGIMEVGVPMGVIVALCPATSPVSTTIYKALIAIKSGNAIIFSPHQRAAKSICKTLDILIAAAEKNGLPEGAISYLRTVTKSGTCELMNHQATSLVMNTGVPSMLEAAYQSKKPLIYGGTGNGPAFIERTADIPRAVEDIMVSKTFDYGIVSAAEQFIVVDSKIEREVRAEVIARGGYFMSEEESLRLGELFFHSDGHINSQMVGISAKELAKKAGFSVGDNIRVLVSEQKYVTKDNPYSKEKLCPVLAYYVEEDWMGACEKCIELILSERHGHTLVIHSRDEEV